MIKIGKIIPLALVVLMGIGCNKDDEVNSGTAASTEIFTGDDNSDFVDNETWSSSISIVWNGTNVTVTGSADGVTVTHSNGYVTVQSTVKNIEYIVSGSGTGQLSIYSDYKFKLSFEGLTLACSDGPAINNQSSKTCYAVLGGTNTLSDGVSYASSSEDRKAAFFSEGQICVSGPGSLSVTGNYKHALASDDYIRLCSGTGTIDLTAKVSAYEINKYSKAQSINHYHIENYHEIGAAFIAKLKRIRDIITAYRYDESNSMVDYFDTNFYYDIDTKPGKSWAA
jgi:hypothetical protein